MQRVPQIVLRSSAWLNRKPHLDSTQCIAKPEERLPPPEAFLLLPFHRPPPQLKWTGLQWRLKRLWRAQDNSGPDAFPGPEATPSSSASISVRSARIRPFEAHAQGKP